MYDDEVSFELLALLAKTPLHMMTEGISPPTPTMIPTIAGRDPTFRFEPSLTFLRSTNPRMMPRIEPIPATHATDAASEAMATDLALTLVLASATSRAEVGEAESGEESSGLATSLDFLFSEAELSRT
jgi:hypothetical protein